MALGRQVEINRHTVEEVRAMAAVADYTPKQWERKVGSLLRIAIGTYGNAPDPPVPMPRGWKPPPPPDANLYRELDRKGGPENNAKRIPGKLDYEYTRTYEVAKTTVGVGLVRNATTMPDELLKILPSWKVQIIGHMVEMGVPFSFTLDIECKTGGGVPNPEQERTIRLSDLNPGRHPWVVYPLHLAQLRKVLGI